MVVFKICLNIHNDGIFYILLNILYLKYNIHIPEKKLNFTILLYCYIDILKYFKFLIVLFNIILIKLNIYFYFYIQLLAWRA